MRRYKRPDNTDISYKIILGMLILAMLMGAGFMAYELMHQIPSKGLFCAFTVWTVFYAVTAYCWIDEDRYNKYEIIMIPILFGLLFLFLVALMIGGFYVLIPKIAAREQLVQNILALIIAEASLGGFAYITYHFFLRDYLVRKPEDSGGRRHK